MSSSVSRPSLISLYKKLSIGWAAAGLILTTTLSLGCFFYLSKQAAETRIETLAQSVARAFRPDILDHNIRDAQFQISRVLNLKSTEHVIVRDGDLKTIYSADGTANNPTCRISQRVCWTNFFREMTYLQPVYFNDDLKDGLFGYVELKISNQFNWILAGCFALVLASIFFLGAWSLYRIQKQSAKRIGDIVTHWADRLKNNPTEKSSAQTAPYTEFLPLEASISKLYVEINKLQNIAAEEVKTKTQLEMLREINHDLKTPFSQLAKFFSVHVSKTRRTGVIDEELIEYMTRSLNRVGDLIRQVSTTRSLNIVGIFAQENADISEISKSFIHDLKKSEINESIEFVSVADTNFAKVSTPQFYRLLDNLVRNAVDAVDPKTGRIIVKAFKIENRPALSVQDNGCGIPPENLAAIFESGFTTKELKGSGLGLSIVKKICDEFNAEISVESQVGVGSTFTIKFLPGNAQGFEQPTGLKEASL